MPLHVSSTCAHHQEVKIALHNLWYQMLCNAILTSWWWAHVLETCTGMKYTNCKTKILCISLVNYWDKYTEMHVQQNVKIFMICFYKNQSHYQIQFHLCLILAICFILFDFMTNFRNLFCKPRISHPLYSRHISILSSHLRSHLLSDFLSTDFYICQFCVCIECVSE